MFFFTEGSRKRSAVFTGAVVGMLGCACTAQAGFTILGNSGWKASWDSSLDPYVDILLNGVSFTQNAVFIEKTAEFTQGPVNGFFPSIAIVFEQIAPTTINNIVIDDEIITNHTGVAWTDFHMDLLDHGDVQFNPAMTLASGGSGPIGWSINPFTQAAFTNGNTRLDIFGGVLPNNGIWNPGGGASDGQLWIHVNNVTPTSNILFILKETPTPAPGAIALLGVAALAGSRRRRRA